MAAAIEIKIAKSKNNVSKMRIMMSNISTSCDLLIHAFENDHKIIHSLNWIWISYNCLNNLIFHIAYYLILKCSNIIDFLLDDKHDNYTKNKICNIEFFLCILFQNGLIMKKVFNNESKWKQLMVFWKTIISHNKVNHSKYSEILYLIGKSQPFWEIEHYLFVIKDRWESILCQANYAGFSKQYSLYNPRFADVTYVLLQNIKRRLVVIRKATNISERIWMLFQARLNYEADKIMKRCENYIKMEDKCVDKLIWISWNRFVNDKIRVVPIMLNTMNPPQSVKMFMGKKVKICTYYKCDTLKIYGCNIKMKICKGCKLTYYCSKRCYKRDWNSKHRYECSKLSVKM